MFQFGNINSPESLRQQSSILSQTEEYAWLRPILESTLDDSLIEYFAKERPTIERHHPAQFESNIDRLRRSAEFLLSKQSELDAIESQAILLALDYSLAQQSFDHDFSLATVRLLESIAASGVADGERYQEALRRKHELMNTSLRARLAQHNTAGSALNFGERALSVRRQIQLEASDAASMMLSIHEGALALGLALPPMVAIDKPGFVKALYEWSTLVAQIHKRSTIREIGFERWYSLARYFGAFGNAPGVDPTKGVFPTPQVVGGALVLPPVAPVQFTISAGDIHGPIGPAAPTRIAGIAVALEFFNPFIKVNALGEENFSKNLSLMQEMHRQLTCVLAEVKVSPPPRMLTSGEQMSQSFAIGARLLTSPDGAGYYSGAHIQNQSPLGLWTIQVSEQAFKMGHGGITLREFVANSDWALRDVHVGFRLIQRG